MDRKGKGSFIYENCIVQQHIEIKDKLTDLFTITPPDRVLEIGTSYGGLTILLSDLLKEMQLNHVPIRTYDIMLKGDLERLNKIDNITFSKHNIFNQHADRYDLVCDDAKKYITDPGRIIIFADGGHKKHEFSCLSDYIKPGDVIMAHDYIETKEIWERDYKDKIWNWCETEEKDIAEACERNNLQPHMQDEMKQVVWACRIKADEQ